MKYELVTIKMLPELLSDLDAYAASNFPVECPKCRGNGEIKSGTCTKCHGVGQVANRSDAVRYLLQYGLGSQASPESRAMAAVYGNVAPRMIKSITMLAHGAARDLHQEIVNAIEASGFDTMEREVPTPTRPKRKRR